jgi:hypothetical protein
MSFKFLGGIKAYGLGFDSTAYIAGNIFELYPVFSIPPPPVVAPGGGLEGVIPLAPGQVQNLYQPVSMDSPYLVPWRQEFKPKHIHHVGIKIKAKDNEQFSNEQYFIVQEPENGFTVEVIPKNKPRAIIVFKPTAERIEITLSKPRASIKLHRRIKIKKLPSNGDK